jgi:hypothetical protein
MVRRIVEIDGAAKQESRLLLLLSKMRAKAWESVNMAPHMRTVPERTRPRAMGAIKGEI